MNNKTLFSSSPLIWGAWRIANEGEDTSVSAVRAKIDTCLEHKITTIDHADIYGDYRAEAVFGAALKEHPALRDSLQLISKCGIKLISENRPNHRLKTYDTSAAHITESVETSLRNLGTEYLDLLLIHRPDPLMNRDEIAGAFSSLYETGKVKSFGVSNFLPQQMELLSGLADEIPLVANQIELNPHYVDPIYDGTLDYCQRHGITPLAWSPFAGGALFTSEAVPHKGIRNTLATVGGRYDLDVDQTAIAWLNTLPSGVVPIIGSQKPERIASAATAAGKKLEKEDWFEILAAIEGKSVA